MVDSGSYTAVVDRIEEDADRRELAVLILEAGEESLEQVVVPLDELPEDGQTADSVLEVVVEDRDIVEMTVRPKEAETRAEEAQSRFDQLARRPPTADEEPNDDSSE